MRVFNILRKVICTAIEVNMLSRIWFGSQFRFMSGGAPEMLGAFIISKFTAGTISIFLARRPYECQSKKYNTKEIGGISYEN